MNNEIKVTGTQKFMGKDIPVVLGGFGTDKKCISDKTIAEIHSMQVKHVRERISQNIKRFIENVDYIDLKKRVGETGTLELLKSIGYAKQAITQAEHIYILSERGYAKLIKIMDTDLAWEIHDKLIDEYFELREKKANLSELSPELQMFSEIFESAARLELKQKEQDKKLEQLDSKVDSIKDVVALRPNAWRKETGAIINKIAFALGGTEHIKAVREQSYKALEERMHVALNIRLANKKKTNALNGMCKSKLDKLNQLDVIADDPKLIEGYIAIIKEMAIKYGISTGEVA